ncbi:hypothetical protein F4809DRAFT_641383 [Biscogniauxia mediterranea]|nr:hypothetical protein F4809DRAFT_641383 [Biscogniauxia mediterranea]
MAFSHSGASTLPKGFRYHDDGSDPKTPEPFAPDDTPPLTSLPRPRLRLKRRHVSQLHAPTQHFLASVAAADVPIPSVEVSDVETADQEMIGTQPELRAQNLDGIGIYQHRDARTFPAPKTPSFEPAPSPAPAAYPDWTTDSVWSCSDLESSPEYESSRPSTAFSTQTSSSLFSHYSFVSDDSSCISPDLETTEFPKLHLSMEPTVGSKDKLRKAPWTKAMSSHLWATYMLYLSDPRVTPIRLGKSCIPPSGVCIRVARQAQRSWKGSKAQTATDSKSGSTTPTAESSKPYIQWPHTCAATRAHLRELCRLKATKKPGRYMSRSPTPFNKVAHRRWNRRTTPARSPSVFSGQDMAMSLTLSTSDTMQPQGPIAQLTSSRLEPDPEMEPFPELPVESDLIMESTEQTHTSGQPRLGSPFLARSHGPSTSMSATGIVTPRKSNSLGSRKTLKSPVRLTRSRSGTQKRRSVKSLEELPRKRPSLTASFWREITRNTETSQRRKTYSTDTGFGDSLFTSRTPLDGSPEPQNEEAGPFVVSTNSPPLSPLTLPPRLGSPFPGSSSSRSFPNRLSSPMNLDLTALRRPFATVQEPAQMTSPAPSSSRSSLASRLAYLDQRLKEFRNRGTERRRSQSPL